ncbi:MAG: hypothetical protein BroJett018_50100 [Chloroflexota bacterium]|nr:MAG: hypothetical protein BroJett018_50100 [Chloroflexota bacterium]
MFSPFILTGVKEVLKFFSVWINRSQITTLITITFETTQAEVFANRLATVLFSDNMVNLIIDWV